MIRSPLKHPVVIGGVVLGLVAVTVLNLRTFLGEDSPLRRGAERAVAHLTPPPDLADVVQEAVRGQSDRTRLAVAGAAGGPAGASALVRDPFSGTPVRSAAPVVRAAQPRPRRAPQPLVCAAVMLGGEQPLALIDGEARRPGQTVRGHLVLDISPIAVRLQRPDGGVLVLPVGQAASDSAGFHVVTGAVSGAGPRDTDLEADPEERNER